MARQSGFRRAARSILVLLACALLPGPAWAGGLEYFVSVEGDDARDGQAMERAFGTIQRGVSALAEGDTLTILPGEYAGSVFRDNLGGPLAETVIRAAIPGTVLLRGDVPVPAFAPVAGRPFVYVTDFDRPVQVVNERNTLRILERAVSPADLDFFLGLFYHDRDAGKLYVSTTHLGAPEARAYTVSVLGTHGLYLERAQRVVIDGLAATGFNSAEILPAYPGYRGAWGIVIGRGVDCVIRNCTAFLNGGGIALHTAPTGKKAGAPGKGNVIEHCRAWANSCRFISEGANIAAYSVNHDAIRDCEAYGGGRGIRLYGSVGPGAIERCHAWDASIQIKGGILHAFEGPGRVDRCIALRDAHVHNLSHSLFAGENAYHRGLETPRDNIALAQEPDLDPELEFADPANRDYRLQATSRLRDAAPDGSDRGPYPYTSDIFYVRAEGDDDADGLSLGQAWKTAARAASRLRAGDTLYLAPGRHAGGMEVATAADTPVTIRGRGRAAVELAGAVRVSGPGAVVFERLRFAGPVTVTGGREVVFRHCVFAETGQPLTLDGTVGVRIEHGRFPGRGPAFSGCSAVYLAGNAYEGGTPAVAVDTLEAVAYSDYNLYARADGAWRIGEREVSLVERQPGSDRYSRVGAGADALAAGPFGQDAGPYRPPDEGVLHVTAPVVHAVTDATADLEWRTSLPADCRLSWRKAGDTEETAWNWASRPFRSVGFSTFSLTGLAPDTEYEFRVAYERAAQVAGVGSTATSQAVIFCTAAQTNPPVSWYVAPDGNDAADGRGRASALRTVSAASARARAGDTVWIAGGTYTELVHVRSTGTEQRPLTFRSLPGEKVVFSGLDRSLSHAFLVLGKAHVRLDGFYFAGFGFGGVPRRGSGMIHVYQGADVSITRCFGDGRGPGYSPPLVGVAYSPRLALRNCVAACGSGLQFQHCPGLQILNTVLFRNLIQQVVVNNGPDQPFRLERNIITDSPANKVATPLLEIARAESLVDKDNAYVLRVPDEERRMFMFYGTNAYAPAALAFDLAMGEDPPVFTETTHLSLAGYQKRFGDTGSRVVDPGFRALATLKPAATESGPVFPPDRISGKRDLDFPDLFATQPGLVEEGIGLQPEAFDDFHFHAREGVR